MMRVNNKNSERNVELEAHTLSVFVFNVSELAICSVV